MARSNFAYASAAAVSDDAGSAHTRTPGMRFTPLLPLNLRASPAVAQRREDREFSPILFPPHKAA